MWNGDLVQCDQLRNYGVGTGVLLSLGLGCAALSLRRALLATLALAGVALIGVGVWRSFESPGVEGRGRTCGSLAGLGPTYSGPTSSGVSCGDALADQATLVAAFVVLGAVVFIGSGPYARALPMTSKLVSRPNR